MRSIALTLLAAGLLISSAAAQTAAPVAGSAAAAPPSAASGDKPISPGDKPISPGDKIVCRDETPTGTQVTQRICEKQSVIDQRREETDRLMNESGGMGTVP